MPSSSFILRAGAVLSALSTTALATVYKNVETYQGANFFSGFNIMDITDPTHGFVNYVSAQEATSAGLVRTVGTDAYIGVDYTTPLNYATAEGRRSVRLEGTKTYDHGLFIIDIKHMPGGVCGTWPAFWSLGQGAEWPKTGEIDIIEGVNMNNFNKMVLHTDTDCKVDGQGQTGSQALYDCALDSASGTSGCDVNTNQANAYGTGFNANGGGVYAMERTSDLIKIWFFPRGQIPASVTAEKPDTKDFGTPSANFQGECDMDTRFKSHSFILDTTFCGDWAGNVYSQSGCPMYSGLSGMDSCKRFVAQNPAAFAQAYWLISSFKTYQVEEPVVSSSSSVAFSTVASTSSSSPVVSSTVVSTSSSSSVFSTSTDVSATFSLTGSSVYSSSTASSSVVSSSASTSTTLSSYGTTYSTGTAYGGSSSAYTSVPYPTGSSNSTYGTPYGTASSYGTPYGTASSSVIYGGSSSAVYPSGNSTTPYTTSTHTAYMSSSTPADNDSSSTPAGYVSSSTPEYGYDHESSFTEHSSHATSTPVEYEYNSSKASSTRPCTTATHPAYPASSSSFPSYESSSIPSYPIPSSPAQPKYPIITPGTHTYANHTTLTTTHTTTYTDICSTGYTKITTTQTITYYPSPTPSTPGIPLPPPGYTVTTKYCATGCAETPITVTLTLPITDAVTPTLPLSTPGVASEAAPLYSHAHEHKSFPPTPTPHAYATSIVTLNVVPVPSSEYVAKYASVASAAYGPVPAAAETPACGGAGCKYESGNVTVSYGYGYGYGAGTGTGTGTEVPFASKTMAYEGPDFTGAASRGRGGGVVVGGFVAVIAMLV